MGRRDDLEALGYIFIYFFRGTLPWFGLKGSSKREKYRIIGDKKKETPVAVLLKGFPLEFVTYFNHCRTCKFEEQPDYNFVKRLFRDLAFREGIKYDLDFDWH